MFDFKNTKQQQGHGGDIYRHPGVLDFSTNLHPLGPPPCVTEAVRESAARISNYPDTEAAELIDALAELETVPAWTLILGNGAAELIYALVQALRPKNALMAVPTFSEYARALAAVDCKIHDFCLAEENGFRLNASFLEEITEDTDVVFLCQPNNPTGLLIEQGLLGAILEKCRACHAMLVFDECFLDFVEGGAALSRVRDTEENTELFILKAFTKRFAMPGLRLGYGICGNAELLNKMRAQLQPWNVSVTAQAAGLAALRGAPDWAERAIEVLRKEKAYLHSVLAQEGFTVYPSEANYLFFSGAAGLAQRLLEENILIRDCANYQGLSEGYYRIAVRTHEMNEKLAEALRHDAEKRMTAGECTVSDADRLKISARAKEGAK